jgi:hypothetical protein
MFEARTFRILRTVTLTIVICLSNPSARAKYGGGTGEPNEPYLIYTAEQMNTIGAESNDWDKHFKLMADIDLVGYSGTSFNIIGSDWNNSFSGVFDGQGHKITNFTWDGVNRNYVGLFGCLKGAEIKDLGLESVYINARGCDYVGGLMGNSNWFCTISNCYVTGSVTGANKVGMLVGYNMAAISNSYSQGSVSGNEWVGGLAGDNAGGAIINCYSSSIVSGYSKVGGLLGAGGGVINSFWDMEISGRLTSAGGAGKTTAQMKTADTFLGWAGCDNKSVWMLDEGNDYPRLWWEAKPGQPLPQIKLSDFLEGKGTQDDPYLISTGQQLNLIGLFTCEWDKYYKLTNDVNLADYTDNEFNIIGTHWSHTFNGVLDGQGHRIINFSWHGTEQHYIGLFGYLDGEIKYLGLEAVEVDAPGCDSVGGLVAVNRGVISNCYVAGDILGNRQVGGLVGYNDTLQRDGATGVIRNCHTFGSVSGRNSVGGLVGANNDQSTISDSYSQSNISGVYQAGGLAGVNNNMSAISDSYATGSVTGNSYVGGLAGLNDNTSTISDSYASGSVSGDNTIGGLVGENNSRSTIYNSYACASVIGNGDFIGGLVGFCYDSSISNSCSKSNVSGNNDVGGLVGEGFDCTITNSYSQGSVDANECVGGLVGSLKGMVSRCYSSGFISGNEDLGGLTGGCSELSIISDSFWDVQNSGQNRMCGRPNSNWCIDDYGRTTAEMQMADTFLEAGWDFVDETANGTGDIWKISDGLNYPHLWWEKYGGGLGEPNDPYRIYTAEQLNTIGLNLEDADKHFKLMADIDLSAYRGSSFNRIGFYNPPRSLPGWHSPFAGIFEGNGHTISNFTYVVDADEPLREDGYYGDENVGLFGYVNGPEAQIKNLGLINPNIYPAASCTERVAYVGAIAGMLGQGSISNCYVEGGRVSADESVGGLVGSNAKGTITDCYATCDVTWAEGRSLRPIEEPFGNTGYSFGGLAGGNSGWIYNCYATGRIQANLNVGGLIGYHNRNYRLVYFDRLISKSYATGDVFGNERVGGLVGSTRTDIDCCYATGSVTGNNEVGGLVGLVMDSGIIRDCYSTGNVMGNTIVGGLIGWNFIFDYDNIINSFWDKDTSGQQTSSGGTGLSTGQMQTADTFLEAGWDFVDETENGTEDIWRILEGQDYPRLWWGSNREIFPFLNN